MNELQEQILALLVAKFQGVRKDGLQHLAAAIGLQVATIEEANGVVDKLTADKVSQYVTDWRKFADRVKRYRSACWWRGWCRRCLLSLFHKIVLFFQSVFVGLVRFAYFRVCNLIDEKLSGVQSSITEINANKAAASRRELFVAELDNAKIEGKTRDVMLKNFDRANTFASDEDFNSYLTEAKGDIAALAQERADAGLQGHDKPIFGAVNKEGVSSGVADYIKAQTESKTALTGKEV